MDQVKKMIADPVTVTIGPIGKVMLGGLVILVLLLVYSYNRALGDADAGLYGMWMVDTNFAERAGLDEMVLFISPPGGLATRAIGHIGTTCKGYMLIKSASETVFNEPISIKIRRTSFRADAIHYYAVDFGRPVACVPARVTIEYDAVTAMITLMRGKMMYARMFKKPEASYYCAQGGCDLDDWPADAPQDKSKIGEQDQEADDEPEKNEESEA